ncbi:LexA family transcriptional regulator [Amphiplicatus metriothermophilus]|uniref:Peptidase S24-like n=1 Tax=Amphiplicatus metriothermophilus TaxID=1519374 RepID=A0A239PWP9_9PROT|nr:LexA family transcriptional regulator [Amphiplicatus metriothermophilus]MBB5519064.1 transcriptional regulator with XRE-family HTH domain [Amphiplicatus metriothermophilus]SNT74751.1 Peptidase S24-like [Amphiplicatus metriothermophilus]
MSSDIEWIRAALRRDPTKTRAGIAAVLGVDKSAVTRLLSGERQLKFHEAEKIAAYLGVAPPFNPPGALADRGRDFAAEGAGSEADRVASADEAAPIYAATALSEGRWSLARHEAPVDWRPRAPHFANAARVFGFYAPDDAMAPRFMAGEIVWVDPARPARPGDDVLFIEKRRGAGPETVILAALLAAGPIRLEGRQHRAGAAVRLDARRWSALHVLPRY